ncbi:hypothetical protein BT96DRAFT_782741, partial [Gymnopus androsaceus JB14]
IKSGGQLRQLFSTLLLFCQVSKPEDLWLAFRQDICDDVRYKLQLCGLEEVDEEDVYDYGLY